MTRQHASSSATRALWLCIVLEVLCGEVTPTRAQSCHAPSGAAAGSGVTVALSLREATIDDGALLADYQGALLAVAYGAPRLELTGVLPAYRLDAGAGAQVGLSDVLLDARVAVLSGHHSHRDHRDHLQLGVELATTLPTGAPDQGLGMGHVMLMPGVFLRAHDEAASLLLQLGYGKALVGSSESGHQHGRGDPSKGALVDPMNASEAEAALTVAAHATRTLSVLASLAGATPIDDEGGRPRAALGLGGSAALGVLGLSLVLELPLLSSLFTQRITASAVVAL